MIEQNTHDLEDNVEPLTGKSSQNELPFLGRRILFIGVGFFGYDQIIVNGLREMGAVVTAVTERPNLLLRSHLSSLINLTPPLRRLMQQRHENELRTQLRGKVFDAVLVIKGDSLNVMFFDFLRKLNPKANFVLYQWDSINLIRDFHELRKRFDRCLTFDRHDAEAEHGIIFRPLFFTQRIDGHGKSPTGLVFVGSLHSERLQLVELMKQQSRKLGIPFRVYVRVGLLSFVRLLLTGRLQDVHYSPLPYSTYVQWTNEAEAVVDFPHPMQTGLTMRTIEAIGLQKKIITTNKDIVNYAFYNQKDICVIDYKEPVIPDVFLSRGHATYSAATMQYFSLRQWLLDVFGRQVSVDGVIDEPFGTFDAF